ncbi:MAG TPA: DUF4340 domain-containing protein [Polyangia bacterium]
MRYTTTIILTVIAAGLAGYVFFVERHAQTSDQVEADRVKLAPGLDRDTVTRIALSRPGSPEIVLEREKTKDAAWRFAAPALGRADATAVSELLSSVEFLEHRARVPDKGARTRAEYGLNPPKATVRLTAGARQLVLHAGNDDATGQGVYAARGDEPAVYVVEKRFRELCDRDADALRDKRVLPVDPLAVKALKAGGATLAKEAGGWMLTAPQRMRAADAKVQDLLHGLDSIRATRFVTAAADPAGVTIVVTADGDHSLTVGGACPGAASEVLAVRGAPDPGSFCLAQADADRLRVDPEALRDLRLLTLRPEEARGVTIRVDGRELSLARDGGAWKVTAPAGALADDDIVRKWLEDLASYRALKAETLDPAAAGVAPGKAPITITIKGEGAAATTIALAAARDGRRWARRGDEPVLLQVHAEAGDLVSADPLYFRSRRVMAVPRWEVKTITLTTGGTTEVAERGAADSWQLVKPITMAADAGVIDKILGALADLRAEKYLPGGAAGGFAAPWALRLDTTPGEGEAPADGGARKAESYTLELGADTAGHGCYARSGGAVLVLSKPVCDDLRVRLASRKLMDLGEQAPAAITIARGGKTETLEKRGPDWHRASGPRVPTEQMDELLGTLRGLAARSVARYGADAGHGLAPARLELTVKLDGGKEVKLAVGAEADAGYYARVAGRDLTYVVPRPAVDTLEKLAP